MRRKVVRKFIRVVFYSSGLFPVQLTLFCTVVSLKVLPTIVFEVETKVLDTEMFPQHTIADLNCGITIIVFFSQKKSLRRQQYLKK